MMEEVSQHDQVPSPPIVSGGSPPPHVANTLPTPVTSVSTLDPSVVTPMSNPVTSAYNSPPKPSPVDQDTSVVLGNMPEEEEDLVHPKKSDSNQGGMWGWISQNTFVQSVVEKTKTGVDKMITTLDPGMTPYLKLGGDITVVVASDKEVKWGAVRDAFQKVFGMADVRGIAAQPSVASQPVGFAAGLRGAQDRISYLRRSGLVDEKQVCVAVESFLAELTPDKWFDIGCILLDDPGHNINIDVYTQAVPVSPEIITHIQTATPADYNLRWSGLSVTVGQAIQHHMPWVEPSDWHKSLAGQSRRAMILSAAISLAGLYKEKFPKPPPGRPI